MHVSSLQLTCCEHIQKKKGSVVSLCYKYTNVGHHVFGEEAEQLGNHGNETIDEFKIGISGVCK